MRVQRTWEQSCTPRMTHFQSPSSVAHRARTLLPPHLMSPPLPPPPLPQQQHQLHQLHQLLQHQPRLPPMRRRQPVMGVGLGVPTRCRQVVLGNGAGLELGVGVGVGVLLATAAAAAGAAVVRSRSSSPGGSTVLW
jgi:hypothetical protein